MSRRMDGSRMYKVSISFKPFPCWKIIGFKPTFFLFFCRNVNRARMTRVRPPASVSAIATVSVHQVVRDRVVRGERRVPSENATRSRRASAPGSWT